MLHNGHGGIDWAGFELVVDWLGVPDPNRLIQQLLIIKTSRRKGDAPDDEDDSP